MLHILLLILKIIGILLLCLLGLLVLGTVCVLFVPVRYRIEAERREGEGEPPVAVRVKVTWLLHFINLALRFDGSLFLRARIMVFTLFRLPKKENRKKNSVKEQSGKGENTQTPQEKETQQESAPPSGKRDETAYAQAEESEEVRLTESVDEGAEEEPPKSPSIWDKLRAIPGILRGIFLKIKSLIENIQYTIQKFCDKIKSVSDTIEYYRKVIEGEAFRRSFALCKNELLRIGKALKPQKFQVQLLIGMDDPAATGEILAVWGMLYPVIGGYVDVAGDFERKRLEGHLLLKGKIRFFTFLRVAVKIYFNKDIRKLYKLLKKEAV